MTDNAAQKKGAFKALNVRAKPKPGRGANDPDAVCEALKESWEDLQNQIDEMDETDQ